MPLMLDNSMTVDLPDVDDLFGDDVALSLPLRPQGKQLHGRLDELRSRGCCQAVAWSRLGTIASLTPDGQSLKLRFLRCHPETGEWDLSEPTTAELIKGSPAIPMVHLEWSAANTPDLAVIDAVGRVTIAAFPNALNRPFVTRKCDNDPVDDRHAVVGCHWLPVVSPQKPFNVTYGPAKKHGNSYQYESSFVHGGGPCHPHPSRSALFCVTIGGMVKMFWVQNDNKLEETLLELESVKSSDELVTHAALASDKKHLLIVVATAALSLKLFKLEIQWVGPGSSSDKNPMPQNARLNPVLVDSHLASTSWLQSGPTEAIHDASAAELSQLHVLPSLMDHTGSNTVPPMIIAIRSRANAEGSFQTAQSVLDRWEAVEERQGLHLAFEQLGNRRNSISSDLPNATGLRKLESIVINKVVVGFQAMQLGKVLLLTMSDGTVEYRDRYSFEELYATEDLARIMSLRQVGWNFPEDGSCQQVAFSPTHCSMVQLGDDGRMRWSKLHYLMGDIGNSMQEAHYAASIAGLAIMAAPSIWHQNNYDDMLAVVHQLTTKKRFIQDWVSELIRILKIQVDFSEEAHHDSLMRNWTLQACLSIMNSLGFRGEWSKRMFQSKFATLDLNIRNVVILISLSSNAPPTVRELISPLDEHEVVEALAGCAKWSLDLLSWLTDCLFELMNDEKFTQRLVPQRFNELMAYLHERNDISLHLILCSSSRSFLSALCRRIVHLEALSNRAIDYYRRQSAGAEQMGSGKPPNPQLQQAYQRMQQVTASSPVRVAEFEKLLSVLGSDIRQAYQAFLPTWIKNGSNPPQGKQMDAAIKTAQVQLEVGMLLGTSPPPAFMPVMKKLLVKDLPALWDLANPATIFFADYTLLGVQDDVHSLVARRARGAHVDLFKRVELRRSATGLQWRRCTRCSSVMEDVSSAGRPGFTFVLGQQRRCSCAGYWALLPEGKLVQ
ncbi:mediator complex subunit 16 domain-containing protein [Hirsutella rhossiliensis]|uniref:Mediator of RNA polymerase II transcription subunit 16 n=1 Tax=Hirsutella rhossiliensis TaxID=111463 RepID=A0A9P8N598_9HYPO|nr:mediator complex subunit 16 domain-containing protein [Hirsutella rhossiliensis]KAH0967185.1 mediator complex subunit 16 domain-containing protein [Hirsutella rhossiliensis]